MEKIIAISARLRNETKKEAQNSLNELSRLAETAGGGVVLSIIQARDKYDPAYLIGKGKADEISRIAGTEKIRTVLFDNDLTASQQRNLENTIDAKIVDRTRLILDIFAMRARTKESSLQIELAQMNYYITRLTQKGIYMDNQVGGIGTRGPGERKLEYDRRRIRDKISHLKKQIEEIKRHREIQRSKRRESAIPLVAIAGYTNAGKSTLLNILVENTLRHHKNPVYADNRLFATLDPTTRRIKLPSGRPALVTDTVGFIRKLPHQLVASFRSTLEEITAADLILHVIDISNSDFEQMEGVVLKTFEELGAGSIPTIRVYNKIDLVPERAARYEESPWRQKETFYVSTKSGEGIIGLLDELDRTLPHLT